MCIRDSALSQLIGDKTRHIYLAHLSQDANLPDLAEMTVRHILKEENVDMNKLNLHMTYPMNPSKAVSYTHLYCTPYAI